ncbi:hypothetical protein A3Q56_02618 [Intoshia linei]|uniref:Uncharacterized protein n=1 Tax=Intoshia linei TaxID=1819745 RepID=A0A177B5S5_9BILA|nr:hypothetical protein A3Q56_02618 [Intoshia linei]
MEKYNELFKSRYTSEDVDYEYTKNNHKDPPSNVLNYMKRIRKPWTNNRSETDFKRTHNRLENENKEDKTFKLSETSPKKRASNDKVPILNETFGCEFSRKKKSVL